MTTEITSGFVESHHLDRSYVDWASILSGALVAVALFTTLMVFGSAIGLSLTSPNPGHGVSGKLAAIAIGLWAAWIAASSFAAGGYITGRLRHRIAAASSDEVHMRDGVHGLVSWSIATLLSGVLLASALGGTASSAAKETSATMIDTEVAQLFHGAKAPVDQGTRGDATALLKSISGRTSLSDDQRAMLAQLVAEKTGQSASDASTRVSTAVEGVHNAVEDARKASIIAAFLTAAGLMIGAAAAWGASIAGGKHRDEGVHVTPLTRWN